MATKITTRFRELLKRPELLVMPGGFSPLHARMAEVLGYDAFFMSGSQVAAYVYGLPDVGLIGFHEMVEVSFPSPSSAITPPPSATTDINPANQAPLETVSQLPFRGEAEKSCLCISLKMQDSSLRSE